AVVKLQRGPSVGHDAAAKSDVVVARVAAGDFHADELDVGPALDVEQAVAEAGGVDARTSRAGPDNDEVGRRDDDVAGRAVHGAVGLDGQVVLSRAELNDLGRGRGEGVGGQDREAQAAAILDAAVYVGGDRRGQLEGAADR